MDKEKAQYQLTKQLLWAMVIKSMFSLGCFTILAIVFNHWWIVFFAALFLPQGYSGDKEKPS